MNRTSAVLAVVLAAAVAACQRAPEQAAPQQPPAYAPATTLAPEPGGSEGLESTPAPGAPAASAQEPAYRRSAAEPAPAPRTSARTSHSRTAASSTYPSTTHRSSGRVDRVDRVPAAEPIDIPTDNRRADARHGETGRDENGRRAEAEPEVIPEPNRDRLVLPAGTELQLTLEEGLSSSTSHQGDAVTARVERATAPDGRIVLPGGTVLKGHVYRAEAAGRVSGRSHLGVDFDRIVVRGVEHRLDTTAIEAEGPESHGRDAAIVGGSTVGGAIIGGILGGGSGAKKGAIIGAVGGTGAVLTTRGKEVEIAAGSHWTVRTKGATRID
jgi:type IV secretory pathway VirB10-like protein